MSGGLFVDDTDAEDYLGQGLAAYDEAGVPSPSQEEVNNLPQQSVQGIINPNQIQVATQSPTAYDNISLDPTTRQAQLNALNQYQDIANAGGLDANAKLGLQQAVNAANTQSQGAQGAIMNAAQAEGQGGGDFALTQRALAAQGASNNAATQGQQAAAEAEANRENALNQMSSIGGNVNASDYNQAAAKAASTNAINAANTQATNTARTGNVANNLAAQTTNLGTAQGVNASNTAAGQSAAYYNAQLPQQQFNNELNKAAGIAGVSGQQAATATQQAQTNAAQNGQLIKGVGTLAAGAMADGGMVAPECYADGGTPHNHYICMVMGGHVPGSAPVSGDSPTNDIVPAKLSPGELVIPRSVPKNGPAMEEFAKKAPVAGNPKKTVDMTKFTAGYKKGK